MRLMFLALLAFNAICVVCAAPALFEVKGNDRTFYVFGTVHMLPPGEGTGWMDARLTKAATAANRLVLEVRPEELRPERIGPVVMKLGIDNDQTPLQNEMNGPARTRYLAYLKSLGVPAAGLDPLKPWTAAIMLTAAAAMKQGFDPESGVEKKMVALPGLRGKPMLGLETAEGQLRIFDHLDRQLQLAFLDITVTESARIGEELTALIALWQAGDIDGLALKMKDGLGDMKPLTDALIDSRNAKWAAALEGNGFKGTSLVAVGAGHLGGPKGLIALLKARGYKVRRL